MKKLGTEVKVDIGEWTKISYESYEWVAKFTSKKFILFLVSCIMVWITLSTYYLYQIKLESIIIFLFVLIIYTLIPIQFSYSDLIKPFVKIILDNGEEVKGILQKMGKFIVITKIAEEKTISINSSKIRLIEGQMVMDKKVENNQSSSDSK